MIYADNAATTQLDEDAFEAMKPFLLECYANASQQYSFAKKVKKALKESRETIAECINAEPEEIIFTSGGTESDNWAVKGFAFSDSGNKAVITSQIEHHAILNSCYEIERLGHPVTYLPVTDKGVITPESLRKYITANTGLVSIMTVNNEIGTIQNIRVLAEVAHDNGALFHTDAVQAVGHIPVDVKELGIDMMSVSAHKFNGPKGIGFLYKSKNSPTIRAFHNGGSQEYELRAGTENIAAIVGMAVALKNNTSEMEKNIILLNHLSEVFLTELRKSNVDFILNGHPSDRLPGNINISIKNRSGEGLMHMLDLKGICISTGSACDSGNQKVSHVIQAINIPEAYSDGTIRITFGKHNTEIEVIRIAEAIKCILKL